MYISIIGEPVAIIQVDTIFAPYKNNIMHSQKNYNTCHTVSLEAAIPYSKSKARLKSRQDYYQLCIKDMVDLLDMFVRYLMNIVHNQRALTGEALYFINCLVCSLELHHMFLPIYSVTVVPASC